MDGLITTTTERYSQPLASDLNSAVADLNDHEQLRENLDRAFVENIDAGEDIVERVRQKVQIHIL